MLRRRRAGGDRLTAASGLAGGALAAAATGAAGLAGFDHLPAGRQIAAIIVASVLAAVAAWKNRTEAHTTKKTATHFAMS